MTHSVQGFCVRGAVAYATQPRVALRFVDIASFEVGQPCLDVSAGDNHEDPIVLSSPPNALALALRFELRSSRLGRAGIRVGHHDQVRVLHCSNSPQLYRIALSDPLFARPDSMRKRKGPDISTAKFPTPQKPSHERIGL